MQDLISRQAAIDIERNATVDTNPSHFEAHQKFMQFMDDAEISSFGRWEWSNGFNTALTAVGIDLKKLPSAQPEPRMEVHKMTVPELIEFLKPLEYGGATGKPREINFCIGGFILEDAELKVSSVYTTVYFDIVPHGMDGDE